VFLGECVSLCTYVFVESFCGFCSVLCVYVCDFVFMCLCGGSDSLTPNEGIVRSRCGGGDATLQSFEKGKERKFFKKKPK